MQYTFAGCTAGALQYLDYRYGCPAGAAVRCALFYTHSDFNPFGCESTEWYDFYDFDTHCPATLTDTTKARTCDNVCFNGLGGDQYWVALSGSASYSLTVPDTVHDALGRGSPTVGADSKTTKGSIGSTFAESAWSIAITGPRSVRVPFACANLTAATDYTLTVEIDRYTAGGGAYVDTITDEIEFTASGTTEDIDYDVEVNTTYDFAYAGVTIAAA